MTDEQTLPAQWIKLISSEKSGTKPPEQLNNLLIDKINLNQLFERFCSIKSYFGAMSFNKK